jgi:hypothetical protein
MGRLIERVIQKLQIPMWERGNPVDADVWVGLKFHWEIEEIDLVTKFPEEKVGKIVYLMPTKFLGGHEFKKSPHKNDFNRFLIGTKSNVYDAIENIS